MIRKAKPDDAPQLAQLIILAMGHLADKFVKNPEDTLPLFTHFAANSGNQYSHQNILVWDDGGIQGMVCAYDGAELKPLRTPFLRYIKEVYGVAITPENETAPGEFYLDCLAVFPDHQDKGLGKKLIAGIADYANSLGYTKIGLLVKKDNPDAKKLYIKTGFYVAEEKIFVGDTYEHLQMDLS